MSEPVARPYGYTGPPDRQPGGSLGRPWQPPAEIVPYEIRPPRWIPFGAIGMIAITVVAMLTQTVDVGYVVPIAVLLAFLLVTTIRGFVAVLRVDTHGVEHVDVIGRRRLAFTQMDRPVVAKPLLPRTRSRTGGGSGRRRRDFILVLRALGGQRPWLFATRMFWGGDELEKLADILDAPTSAARTRADLEKTYPGSTTWLLRRSVRQKIIGLTLLVVITTLTLDLVL